MPVMDNSLKSGFPEVVTFDQFFFALGESEAGCIFQPQERS